jgi:hypothetical protein
MELIGIEKLTEILDISRIPNLEKLLVEFCHNLSKVPFCQFFHALTLLVCQKASI